MSMHSLTPHQGPPNPLCGVVIPVIYILTYLSSFGYTYSCFEMAEDLYDGEFWLPPQFLIDDDILMDFKKSTYNAKTSEGDVWFSREIDGGAYFHNDFPTGFGSFCPNSDLSSPVESVVGSTKTESDEEEYLKLARFYHSRHVKSVFNKQALHKKS
ncbi:unnamed protein product [Ilex paraguariensis]|uniref:Uncharacterized protein n=1 Tax=Ilex paraguariensis TaxID=185542 RepID=A0ABC8QMK5_9AQUA